MNDEVIARLNQIIELQKEILNWIEILGRERLVKVAQENLVKEEEKIVYHLSDGASSVEISKVAPVSHMTVTNYWKKWAPLGLVKPSKKWKGRFEKVLPLESLGIEVPQIKSGEASKHERE